MVLSAVASHSEPSIQCCLVDKLLSQLLPFHLWKAHVSAVSFAAQIFNMDEASSASTRHCRVSNGPLT